MPSNAHEIPIEFVKNRPRFVMRLLEDVFDVALPRYDYADMASENCTKFKTANFYSDRVVALRRGSRVCMAVIAEVQRRRDKRKRYSWPVYLATVHENLKCPVLLLVFCPDEKTAVWARKPIELGQPGMRLVPFVVGPDQIPVVVSVEEARELPELAVLSALAHGGEEEKILVACAEGLNALGDEEFSVYHEYVVSALTGAARENWDALMADPTFTYRSDFARRYINEGKAEAKAEARAEAKAEARAEAKAEAVVAVLGHRGLHVSGEVEGRITACTDLDRLDTWMERAFSVDAAEDIFD
ncbi:hypothetical protein [Streptomonospora wellingtoniae]|uniref:DUF4365 domain-containing protein n=1 Tax=Streptomonospora wellingtoniae TaxID=3075544 RepID=A0ABU2KZ88_9ACTN|nr:hypothetical protein [Streptomonospora sp. DSM 45055]MDT0304343.1 hypothetical protein [Streptomonospora sp. DSM 45055]